MKRGPYPLEAAVELPASLLFGSEFVGLLKPATIGGVDVHVALPNFNFEPDKEYDVFTVVLHPRAHAKWVEHYEKPSAGDRAPFGKVTIWHPSEPNGGIKQFWTQRLLLLSKSKVTEAEARKLLHAVDKWVLLLDKWIEVFTRTDLREREVEVTQYGASAYVWLYRGKDRKGKTVSSHKPTGMVVKAHSPLAITPRQWGQILKKASGGAALPEAHLFLRDARRELGSKRYRRSVLDAATATEVALAKLRDDALLSSDQKVGAYVQESAQQVRRLVEFLKAVGQKLPDAIVQEVGTPRNRAIHEGKDPDKATATKALMKAEEVLDLAYPWQKLL
jgi:hypothetical protein